MKLPNLLVNSRSLVVHLILISSLVVGEVPAARASGSSPWMECDASGRAGAIGINVNNLSFDALASDNVIAALVKSGAGWVRISMYWGWIERAPGQFNWKAVDVGLNRLQAAQINALVTLAGPVPCWALDTTTGAKCNSPRQTIPPVKPWVDFVTAAVSRYSKQVHYWEVWNEPDLIYSVDLDDPHERLTQYRDNILIPGAQAIHKADPAANVVGPALAAIPSGHTAVGTDLRNAFSTVMKGAGASNVDIVSIHSYFPDTVAAKVSALRDAMRAAGMGTKPIWITEVGLKTEALGGNEARMGVKHAESRQAQFLQDEVGQALSNGSGSKVFWFALTDSANKDGEHSNHFGLINNSDYKSFSWQPRPAYSGLQQMIQSACSK